MEIRSGVTGTHIGSYVFPYDVKYSTEMVQVRNKMETEDVRVWHEQGQRVYFITGNQEQCLCL